MERKLLKTLFKAVNIFCIIFLLLTSKVSAQTWQVLGQATLPTTGTATYTKIATAQLNGVVIPYIVYSETGIIKVKRFINFAWQDVGGNVSDGAAAQHCVIAISSVGDVFVAYRDDSNGFKIAVKQFNSSNSTWEAVGGGSNSIYANAASVDYGVNGYNSSYQIALAIDNNNVPYVSYVENLNTVYVSKFTSNAWSVIGSNAAVSPATATYSPSLSFDENNNTYLVYHEMSGTSGNIKAHKFDGTTWTELTTGTTLGTSRSTSCVIDRVNKKLIINFAYAGNGTRSTIVTYNYNTNVWSHTVAGGTFIGWNNKASTYNSVAVDKLGNAYALWIDDMATNPTKMPFMKKLNSGATTWVEVNNPSTTGGILGPYDSARLYTSSAVTGEGTPFVVFVKNNLPVVAGFSSLDLNTVPLTLPVSLSSLAAKADLNSVKVSWVTSSEINNDKFVVEKSTDGKSFSKIGEVKAQGPSSYSLNDYHPANGTNYYHLVQYDFNGKSEVFGPVAVNFDLKSNSLLVLYPNPTQESISFHANGLTGAIQATLLDMSGKVVYKENFVNNGGSNYTLNMGQKPQAGQYLIQVRAKGFNQTKIIVVQ